MSGGHQSAYFEESVERFWKVGVGGATLTLPVILGSVVGVPEGVMLVYLAVMVLVLTILVLHRGSH